MDIREQVRIKAKELLAKHRSPMLPEEAKQKIIRRMLINLQEWQETVCFLPFLRLDHL
ncbi:hypothetical protein SAMN05660649_00630 [Desulfotomaculum arcticum]|uniref:Uncharacterized protein n=1 Tax=Desulfotruncus arcticus DSM 17038 TaxID=1121424 RepID=A0A1I2P1E4_9FIRM|nr:hypothetical protein [Desulfotruncus arcticus]SFG08879.1 hypothetical protein SAMN05660649_00630 [Desulfotomaculum arcticum] [Desulfotruncus arcticus DSM 17038]